MKRLALVATLTLTGLSAVPAVATYMPAASSLHISTVDDPPCNYIRVNCPHK